MKRPSRFIGAALASLLPASLVIAQTYPSPPGVTTPAPQPYANLTDQTETIGSGVAAPMPIPMPVVDDAPCECELEHHYAHPSEPSSWQRFCGMGSGAAHFAESNRIEFGGWAQLGYHSKNGGLRFNQHADNLNLHQGWLFAERALDTAGGFDFGGRVDYLYGVDAQDTQAFGISNDHWDNGWDNGIYGHALPQAYFEVGYGDLSIKTGKFFTIIGNEVVAAPGNFFYSHAYTMYNSEPFTHTGALATWDMTDNVTLYGGYTLGWDSGFEDNGDNYLGGITVTPDDATSLTYTTAIGRFNRNAGVLGNADERGFLQSLVLTRELSHRLSYIFQTDYLDTDDGQGNTIRNTRDITQYLLYRVDSRLSVGTRFEWWNVAESSSGLYGDNANLAALALNGLGGRSDVYALTIGANYRPYENVVIRPEVRWDWVAEDRAQLNAADIVINENNDSAQTTFGIDTILIF